MKKMFARWASACTVWLGHPYVCLGSVLAVVVWAAMGPYFQYSDTWQLCINTITTVITFNMVFFIQNSQNRDNAAIQAKLDELIKTSSARNMFMGIEEDMTDEEIRELKTKAKQKKQPRK